MIVVLYHAGCPDGHTAAWAAWKKFGNKAEYIAVSHNEPPPQDLEGKEVYIVDFCYPRNVLLELKDKAKSLKVLDHHISAQRDCGDLDFCHFDMNKSGAGIAWEYFHSEKEIPWLISYIQYRDLGFYWNSPKEEHPPHLQTILAAVDSYEKTFERWDQFYHNSSYSLNQIQSPMYKQPALASLKDLISEGEAILRYKNQLINSLLHNVHRIEIDGQEIEAINSPLFQSELGNLLASKGGEYSAVWYQGRDKVKFSLRSQKDGADVALVAGKFPPGGGHAKAAGFSIESLEKISNRIKLK